MTILFSIILLKYHKSNYFPMTQHQCKFLLAYYLHYNQRHHQSKFEYFCFQLVCSIVLYSVFCCDVFTCILCFVRLIFCSGIIYYFFYYFHLFLTFAHDCCSQCQIQQRSKKYYFLKKWQNAWAYYLLTFHQQTYKMPDEIFQQLLQNLPYFWNTQTLILQFFFVSFYFIFSSNECPLVSVYNTFQQE